jgi:serine/threonine protein kinase
MSQEHQQRRGPKTDEGAGASLDGGVYPLDDGGSNPGRRTPGLAGGIPSNYPSPNGIGTDTLREGSRFGAYMVGACIGQGGMARVYRAEHEGLQRQVALKVLVDGLGNGSDAHERFLREARIAAAIKHPNVVNIFDVGVHQGTPYLVMELLEGLDLEGFVQSKGRLDESMIMDIIVPVAAGLAAVHDAGIVHRDLKPGNIFLARGRNEEIEPRLLDFGISKSSGPDNMKLTSARGLLLGTPFYMSPEAARGAEMTPLSDQYSLGVVLYECATGVNPFAEATTFADVVRRVTTGDVPNVAAQNPLLSKRMVSIIERSMHLDPARRFPDIRAMGRELLMLAGQRTRVTWSLSFSEIVSRNALARVHPLDAAGGAVATRREAPAKIWYLVPAALVLLGAFGAKWMGQHSARPRVPEVLSAPAQATNAAPPATDSAESLALRPTTSPPSPSPATVAPGPTSPFARSAEPVANPAQPVPAAGAAEDVVSPPSAATAKADSRAALRAERSNKRGRKSPAKPAVATSSTSTPGADGRPDWIATHQSSGAATARGPNHGTNNAPILD